MAEAFDITYTKCNKCSWSSSFFKASCPACGGSDLSQARSSGTGNIVDFVPVFYPPENLKDLGQYTSVLVRFREGFKMFAIFLTNAEELAIGDSVAVSSFDEEKMRLFVKKVALPLESVSHS